MGALDGYGDFSFSENVEVEEAAPPMEQDDGWGPDDDLGFTFCRPGFRVCRVPEEDLTVEPPPGAVITPTPSAEGGLPPVQVSVGFGDWSRPEFDDEQILTPDDESAATTDGGGLDAGTMSAGDPETTSSSPPETALGTSPELNAAPETTPAEGVDPTMTSAGGGEPAVAPGEPDTAEGRPVAEPAEVAAQEHVLKLLRDPPEQVPPRTDATSDVRPDDDGAAGQIGAHDGSASGPVVDRSEPEAEIREEEPEAPTAEVSGAGLEGVVASVADESAEGKPVPEAPVAEISGAASERAVAPVADEPADRGPVEGGRAGDAGRGSVPPSRVERGVVAEAGGFEIVSEPPRLGSVDRDPPVGQLTERPDPRGETSPAVGDDARDVPGEVAASESVRSGDVHAEEPPPRDTPRDGSGSPERLTWDTTPEHGLRALLRGFGRPADEVLVENMWTGRVRTMRWDARSWSLVEDHGRLLYEAVRDVVISAVVGDAMAPLWDALQPDSDDAAYVRRFGRLLAGLQAGDPLSPLVGMAVQTAAAGVGVPAPGAMMLGRIVAQLLWDHGDHDAITRRRLAEAVSVADVALFAHHGVLAECPGLWLLAKARTNGQVAERLRRYLS